ncbi:sulfotransferase [uncultured Tateyamaria sp.]|uniref:sulfotransferase family protein n=1 Tax=Tateyamaria sp. 1078 TaxID=3417464 RepID=UPI002613FC30|nr:sulfotransferase [uncultured Tateyamaria sp.]
MVRASNLVAKLPLLGGKRQRDPGVPMGRFVVMGLPRSGTTYLMMLLDAHRDIACTGEQFNPRAVVDVKSQDDSAEVVLARDSDPLAHLAGVFAAADARGVAQGGFKFMLGHNITVLRALAEDPELRIIYVWRENRLAQIASLFKAAQSQRWAQTKVDAHVTQKIEARPRQISQRWHEFATTDFLTAQWLDTLPQQVLTLEYRTLFAPETPNKLCEFLGVEPDSRMVSPLVKQGANRVIDRFTTPGPIAHYFTQIGRKDWLGEEL